MLEMRKKGYRIASPAQIKKAPAPWVVIDTELSISSGWPGFHNVACCFILGRPAACHVWEGRECCLGAEFHNVGWKGMEGDGRHGTGCYKKKLGCGGTTTLFPLELRLG
jgi:hypothetical protein